MKTILEDMFDEILAMTRYPLIDKPLSHNGFKDIIRRPHNLYTIKDDDGNIVAYKLDVVTTPFKKDDVKIKVLNDILTVSVGNDDFKEEDSEHMTFRGISSQTYEFQLKLNGIDQKNITAKVEDGILHIKLPVCKKEQPKPLTINVD